MNTFNHLLERLALAILLIGGVGLMASMFLGVGDVVGTQILEQPLPGARELTESTMVLIVFGALTYAQIQRSHIRVELLYTRMGPRVQAMMDVATDLAAILFFGLLFWQAVNEVQISIEIGESTVERHVGSEGAQRGDSDKREAERRQGSERQSVGTFGWHAADGIAAGGRSSHQLANTKPRPSVSRRPSPWNVTAPSGVV